MKKIRWYLMPLICLVAIYGSLYSADPPKDIYFTIQVVDDQTGRPVPLVELTTVNNLSYFTDNNGIVAFYEPGLMNRELFFYVKSHGYEFPKDGFGYAGKRLYTRAGSKAVLKIKRIIIAERLYRITGYGTYRDSVLVGEKIPVKEPLLNGKVFGQDTAIAAVYKGKIYWFWGDTMFPNYPLGNFAVSGATSELPENRGLQPSAGINLTYFVDSNGFSKPMCPVKIDGPKWLEGLMVLKNPDGGETLLARYAAVKDLGHINEFGLAVFNDKQEVFEKILTFPTKEGFHKSAHPALINFKGEKYYYIFPTLRVKARIESIKDLNKYENFTCVKNIKPDGSREVDLSIDGKPRFLWRKGIAPFNPSINEDLVRKKLIKPEENWIFLHDVQTGKPTKTPHLFNGSICWNNHRKNWIMITQGEPGEVWFAESDTPTGQWVYARRIVNHDKYNFYNPVQHRFFDENDGATIYFEGTYTATFSGAKNQTPIYDYNQVMYRLNLLDERLILPMPVYEVLRNEGKEPVYIMGDGLNSGRDNDKVVKIPFYAIPLRSKLNGLEEFGYLKSSPSRIIARSKVSDLKEFVPAFSALPSAAKTDDNRNGAGAVVNELNSIAIPLYEYLVEDGNGESHYIYSTQEGIKGRRSPEPICRVWKNPLTSLAIDIDAKAER
ncbi:MAG: hypothetical protein ACP5T0_04595 [Verrucomicrobiia bacterium]